MNIIDNVSNSNSSGRSNERRGERILIDNDVRENDMAETPLSPEWDEATTSLQLRDGGYAWLVLSGIFFSTFLIHGFCNSFGILSSAVLDFYPDSSGTMAGIIIGLLSAFRNILAPFIGILANRVGLRRSMRFGAILYAGALVLSFFCTSVAQLAVTLGVLIGISQCIIESSQINVLSQYFVKKLSIANGVRGAASPFGGIIYPIILTALLEYFGLKLTFLLLGAINFHTLISATLMRPLSIHLKIKALEKTRTILKNTEIQEKILRSSSFDQEYFEKSENCDLNPNVSDKRRKYFTKKDKEKLYLQIVKKYSNNIKLEKPRKKLQVKIFKDPNYLLYIFIAFILPMAIPLVTYYTILYTKNHLGMTAYEVTTLVSFQSATDFLLRICIGYINNKNLCNKSVVLMICLWICAVGILLIPLGRNLTVLMVALGLYSFGPSAFIASLTVILCEEFGKENITSTWGFVKMTHGIFAFLDSLLIGYVLDATGGYTIPFVIMGCGIGLCGCFMAIQVFARKYYYK